jgi:hypothetical protein
LFVCSLHFSSHLYVYLCVCVDLLLLYVEGEKKNLKVTNNNMKENISVKTVQQFERGTYEYVDLANSGKMRMYVCIFKIIILVFLNPELALFFFSNISLVQIYRCIYIQSCLSSTVICLFHFFFLYI